MFKKLPWILAVAMGIVLAGLVVYKKFDTQRTLNKMTPEELVAATTVQEQLRTAERNDLVVSSNGHIACIDRMDVRGGYISVNLYVGTPSVIRWWLGSPVSVKEIERVVKKTDEDYANVAMRFVQQRIESNSGPLD